MIRPSAEEVEQFSEAFDYEEAVSFLLAGGTFTLWDWMTLPQSWRDLLVLANDRVKALDACRKGRAIEPDGRAELMRPIDGGESRASLILERAASRWEDTH